MHAPESPSRAESLRRLQAKLANFDRASFPAHTLARAASVWARRAQNEHASIAAFDRFCLGLLAVAAPPELIEAAHEAALDEILHARLCFAIASTYGDAPVGPGPLEIEHALDGVGTLAALVESTIVEGCVGETISAAEAREAFDQAREPAAREALSRIASDEERHAELAWAFVQWGLSTMPALRPRMSALFSSAIARARVVADSQDEDDLTELGIVSTNQKTVLRRRILDEVIVPASRALFEPSERNR